MCGEADTLAGVGVDELPNASPQDGANKDVSVENDHLSGMRPSRSSLKSATSSSSSTSASALANFQRTQAHDWSGPRRSLVVLLCFG
jgi:hypothetical protein